MSVKHSLQVHLAVNHDEVFNLSKVDSIKVVDYPLHIQGFKDKVVKSKKEVIGDLQHWRRDHKTINLSDKINPMSALKNGVKS